MSAASVRARWGGAMSAASVCARWSGQCLQLVCVLDGAVQSILNDIKIYTSAVQIFKLQLNYILTLPKPFLFNFSSTTTFLKSDALTLLFDAYCLYSSRKF